MSSEEQKIESAAAAPGGVEEEKKEESAPESNYVAKNDENLEELFVKLDSGVPSEKIPSLCMDCKQMGETRFMYTEIPMFKQIIISAFVCDHCGNRNTEVQFGGKLGDTGVKFELNVSEEACLNRSVVKSEFATIRIPEIDFEIPPQT
jgi:zinc finger protein